MHILPYLPLIVVDDLLGTETAYRLRLLFFNPGFIHIMHTWARSILIMRDNRMINHKCLSVFKTVHCWMWSTSSQIAGIDLFYQLKHIVILMHAHTRTCWLPTLQLTYHYVSLIHCRCTNLSSPAWHRATFWCFARVTSALPRSLGWSCCPWFFSATDGGYYGWDQWAHG